MGDPCIGHLRYILIAATAVIASAVVAPGSAYAFTAAEDARDGAFGCSDAYLDHFAKNTREPVDTIALAAFAKCHELWLKAAAAYASEKKAIDKEGFEQSFLAGAEQSYLKRGRPMVILKRLYPASY